MNIEEIERLEQQSIDAAMNLDWAQAIKINNRIIKNDKKNLGAHLRLGFAYLQLSELAEAKRVYKQTLKIQSENVIAHEHLEKIEILESRGSKKTMSRQKKFDPNLFLEVPGKTKTSLLVNIGQKNILAQLTVGEEVYIKSKKIKAEIRTESNEYVGSLPDDLSKRLFLFFKVGSEYSCFIKEISLNRVIVFIREDKKGKKVARYSSFPKNIQTNMAKVSGDEQSDKPGASEETDDELQIENLSETDLDRLAENLTHEDKEFFNYEKREEDDEENLEE